MRATCAINLALLLAMALSLGCEAQSRLRRASIRHQVRQLQQMELAPEPGRTLALNSPRLSAGLREAGNSDSQMPWYFDRNDRLPATWSDDGGYEQSVTRTYDRYHQYSGRVYDHYQRTTYSRTWRAGPR